MPKNKCGLTREQREKILHSHGFQLARNGKGSHEMWEHPELKLLARTHEIKPPDNLKSGNAQNPWMRTIPDNPANGTWNSIIKYAKWCQKTVEDVKANPGKYKKISEVASQFRAAAPRNGKRKPVFENRNSAIHSRPAM